MFIFSGSAPAIAGSQTGSRRYWLDYKDYEDIRREATLVRSVTPILSRGDIRVASDFQNANGQIMGVMPQFTDIRFTPIGEGRWINDADNTQKRQVVVIGDEMRRNLFSGEAAVNSTLLLNGIRFQVIGIVSLIGRKENTWRNNNAYIPYETMRQFFPMKNVPSENVVNYINYRPITRDAHEAARMQVHRIIARNHGFDYHMEEAFDEWDSIKSSQMVGGIFDAMDKFLGGVGIVTLVLGGIGVINIMLVAVTERTREIGLRKALGATNGSILTQFFLEGIILTLMSGGLGIAAAAGLCGALALLPAPPGFDTPRIVPMSAILAVGSLSLAGVVAGLYPARKAALLQPVEALRQE